MSIIEVPQVSEASPAADGSHDLPLIVASLRARYPDLDPAVVQRCVEAAAQRFEDARIRTFLPTLIERSASEALRSQGLNSEGLRAEG